MDLSFRVRGDETVHEVEELDALRAFGGIGLFKPIDAPFDRIEPLVLPRGLHHDVGKLLERRFDLGDALVDILELRLHSEECCRSRDHKADRCQNVTVGDGAIEQRLWPLDPVFVVAHVSTFASLPLAPLARASYASVLL